MQTKLVQPNRSAAAAGPPAVHEALHSAGQPLDASTRAFMEPRFGHDFSRVRVHTDSKAGESTRGLRARAYTVGTDIVFGNAEYAPGTETGRQLIAHELAHVVQQRGPAARPPVIQRAITLTDPGSEVPHAPGAMGPFPTKELTLGNWLDTLCPEGNWEVDAGTGVVDSPDRGTFCGARPTRGHAHHKSCAHPTSCGCLCELTAGPRTVEVQIDENLTVGGAIFPLAATGEGATSHSSPTDKVSAFSGKELVGIPGAGATTPHAGAGRAQTLPDPPWVIFGHEVCGHARLQAGLMGATQVEHSTTPEGNRTAVDVENRIRRELSTTTASLGIRGGSFKAKDAAGMMASHSGSVYRVRAGETLSGIAARAGIAVADMLDHIWRSDGSRITAADQDHLMAGEELLIEGIDWHEVIRDETMSAIAQMWDVPLASLKRANPQITGASFVIRRGARLLIPAS